MDRFRFFLILIDVSMIMYVLDRILTILIAPKDYRFFRITVFRKGSKKAAEKIYLRADAAEADERIRSETDHLLRKNHLTEKTADVSIRETSEEEYENSLSKR